MSSTKNIIYAATKNLYPCLPTVINSLLTNNPDCNVYVLCEDDSISCLSDARINIVNINNYPTVTYNDNPSFKRFSYMVMYKLAVPNMLTDIDRCIFLDVDTLVDGSLDELWETDMQGNCFGIVLEHKTCREKGSDNYFNAGVLLMDTKKIRELGVSDYLLQRASILNSAYLEQDTLNLYAQDLIYRLDSKWNFGPTTKWPDERPRIRHYMDFPKAWDNRCRDGLWQKYYTEKL